MFENPFLVGFLAALLLFVFFIYLFLRRTVTGFKEGIEKGRR